MAINIPEVKGGGGIGGVLNKVKRVSALSRGDVLGAAGAESAAGQLNALGEQAAGLMSSGAKVTGSRGPQGQANLGVDTNLGYKQPPKFEMPGMGAFQRRVQAPSLGAPTNLGSGAMMRRLGQYGN